MLFEYLLTWADCQEQPVGRKLKIIKIHNVCFDIFPFQLTPEHPSEFHFKLSYVNTSSLSEYHIYDSQDVS